MPPKSGQVVQCGGEWKTYSSVHRWPKFTIASRSSSLLMLPLSLLSNTRNAAFTSSIWSQLFLRISCPTPRKSVLFITPSQSQSACTAHGSVRRGGQNLRIPGQRAALGRHAGHGPVLQPTIRTRRLLSHIHHSLVFEMFEKVKQTLIEPPDRPFHASSRKVFGAKYFASKVSLFRPKLTRELVSREI